MKRSLLLFSSICFCAVPVWAQETAPAQTAPVPPASTTAPVTTDSNPAASRAVKPTKTPTGEYRISREDTLTITCLNAQEYNVAATVLPDGTISYPKMGQIKVAGKTLKQVEAQITQFLKKEFVRPQVSVGVRERQVRQVSVIGTGIRQPGKRIMRDGWTVREAISDAGGLLSDRNDLFTATVLRYETGERFNVDLVALYSDDSSTANLPLEPNDTVIVDAAEESKSQVQVVGEVGKPGFVLIPRDRTISKALDAAGGFKPTALLSEVVVERNGEKFPVDLRQYTKDGTEPTLRLLPGDRLVVPENKRLFYIIGAAGRQGATLLPDDRSITLIDAMGDAGVPFNQAEIKQTQIIRKNASGAQVVTVINVEEMQKKKDYSKAPEIQPGDTVYIPFKGGRKYSLQDATNTAFGIVQLRSLFNPNFYRF